MDKSLEIEPSKNWLLNSFCGLPVICWVAIFLYGAAGVLAFIFLADSTEWLERWGQAGDYVGGFLNPVFGILTIVLLASTLRQNDAVVQRSIESAHETRMQLSLNREADCFDRALELVKIYENGVARNEKQKAEIIADRGIPLVLKMSAVNERDQNINKLGQRIEALSALMDRDFEALVHHLSSPKPDLWVRQQVEHGEHFAEARYDDHSNRVFVNIGRKEDGAKVHDFQFEFGSKGGYLLERHDAAIKQGQQMAMEMMMNYEKVGRFVTNQQLAAGQ